MDEKDTKQVIVVRRDLHMRRGKEIAQGCHSSGAFVFKQLQEQILRKQEHQNTFSVKLTSAQQEWIEESYAKVVCQVENEEELRALELKAKEAGLETHIIIDSGRTEFNGVPTITCIAIGPDFIEKVDAITKSLKLY